MMGDSSAYKSTLDCFVKTLKNDVCFSSKFIRYCIALVLFIISSFLFLFFFSFLG